jgi:two-component system, LytTR family, response regulator
MNRPIRRAVVIDDEPGARSDLLELLRHEPGVTVVGEAADVEGGTRMIDRVRPDLIFLDIQLGQRSGFELLDRLEQVVPVIFVTAHDQHAIRAFEVNAVDYLLKPVVAARLRSALERSAEVPPPFDPGRALDYEDWLFLPIGQGRKFLRVKTISHLMASGDYSRLVGIDGGQLAVATPLSTWERRLPDTHFLRIHRGTIINLEQVDRVEPWSNYTYRIYLRNLREPLSMSRSYARRAERLLR